MTGTASTVSYLLFRAGPYDLAVAAGRVRHLDRSVRLRPIEGSPRWLAGMAEVANRGVPVVDVAARLGLSPDSGGSDNSEAGEPAVIVVANPRVHEAFPEVGLLVGRIADTVRISSAEARQLRRSSNLPIRDWVQGAYRGRSRAAYLLDIEKVIPAGIGLLLDPPVSSHTARMKR